MADLERIFPSSFFAKDEISKILQKDEQKLLIMNKTKNTENIYSTFNDDFSAFLGKLPPGPVKDNVTEVFNKGIVFLAVAKIKPDNIVTRPLLIDDDKKLGGIGLSTQQLSIDPTTGSTNSIDECIYASYFSLIRAAVLINRRDVRQDKDLHKLLSTYLYNLLMKAIGPDKIYSQKQREFVHILCIYIYYKAYLKEKHSYIISIIQRDYDKFINKQSFEEFLPTLEKMEGYDSVKDFPKMLIDAKILNESPNILIITLLKMLKPMGFYSLIGPLDYFVSLVVVSKYPVDFIGRKSLINEKIQNAVEEIIVKYIDRIKYDTSLAVSKK